MDIVLSIILFPHSIGVALQAIGVTNRFLGTHFKGKIKTGFSEIRGLKKMTGDVFASMINL
jgi:hypothetical protein